MNHLEKAQTILDEMLGLLGFSAEVYPDDSLSIPALQTNCKESNLLVGRDGKRLEDLEFLVNRFLHKDHDDAPQIRIDIGHYKAQQEQDLVEEILTLAKQIKSSGEPVTLQPMNSFYRRLVHNAFANFDGIKTTSPSGSERLKSVTISPSE